MSALENASDGKPEHRFWNVLTSSAAPLTVVSAAAAYVSGAFYKNTLLNLYGLDGGVINEPLQATMVKGYEALIVGGVITLLVQPIFWIIAAGIDAALKFLNLKKKVDESVAKRFFDGSKHSTSYYAFVALLLVVCAGFTGSVFGWQKHLSIQSRLRNNCQECVLYNTKRGRVSGVPILGDTQIMIVATRTGVVRLEYAELKAWRIYSRPILY